MSLPVLAHTADIRTITERVNVLIRDLNTGRADDLTQALADIAALQVDVAALQALHDDDATVFLTSNVAMNNTGNFFSGPNTGSIGAAGQKWLITATFTVRDTSGAAVFTVRIFDGASALTGTTIASTAVNQAVVATLCVVVDLSAATTFTAQAQDGSSTNGVILATGTGGAGGPTNKATSISAVRLA